MEKARRRKGAVVKQEVPTEVKREGVPRLLEAFPKAKANFKPDGRGDGEKEDALSDSRSQLPEEPHRPQPNDRGDGRDTVRSVSVLYCNVGESADIEDVAKDLRNMGATILLMCCATRDIASSISVYLERAADGAKATIRGGGERH